MVQNTPGASKVCASSDFALRKGFGGTRGWFSGVSVKIAVLGCNSLNEVHDMETFNTPILLDYIAIYALVFRVNLPPAWYGPMKPRHPPSYFIVPSLGYLPSIFAFIPALRQTPCKYQHIYSVYMLSYKHIYIIHIYHHIYIYYNYSQRLRFQQSHPSTPTTGGGEQTMTMSGGGATLEHLYLHIHI